MSYIAGSGMQLINSSILGSDTTAPAFSSIPGNFNNLRLELMGRTDDAASNADIFMRFNSDSGNNYDYQYFVGANTSSIIGTAQAVNGMLIGTFPANNATASCAGIIIIDIVAYAKTSFLKVYQSTLGLMLKQPPMQKRVFSVANIVQQMLLQQLVFLMAVVENLKPILHSISTE